MLKKTLSLVALAATLSIYSCGGDTTTQPKEQTKEVVSSHENWDTYFADFQAAVAKSDSLAIVKLSDFSFVDSTNNFIEYGVLNNYSAEKLAKVKAEEVKTVPSNFQNEKFKSDSTLRVIDFSEKTDGEYTSYEIYYFIKVNGLYKLVDVLMAG